jgi:cytoplasmic iron level regulating protein YaaA (DUF328/UPF0246 family)
MIILLSPAKTLDYETPINDVSHSIPSFLPKSKDLIKTLKDKKPEEISKLMKISEKLALLNTERYKSWKGLKKNHLMQNKLFLFSKEMFIKD